MPYSYDFEVSGARRAEVARQLTDLQSRYAFRWEEQEYPGQILVGRKGATFVLHGAADEIVKVRRELALPDDREMVAEL